MNKTIRPLFALPLLCSACGLAIIIAYTLLSPRIETNQREATEAIYFDTLQLKSSPDIQLDSTHTTGDTTLLGLRAPQPIYMARHNHRIIGIVLPLTARDGYAGDIDLLLGVDTSGKVISVHVLSQRETRDLGDNIEPSKSHWLEQFRGTSFEKAQKKYWQLRDEGGAFDGITGATVTSRAVIKAVQQALAYFEQHRDELVGDSSHE